MSTDQIKFTDGRLHETEIYGCARTRFPFKENSVSPDRHARIHTRAFRVDPRQFVTKLPNRTSCTNLLSYSDAFDVANWANLAEFTRTADNTTNPWDGATSVDRLLETAANAAHLVGRAYTFTAVAHTLWAILAPVGGRQYWRLRAYDGTNNFDAVFDLVAGVVVSASGSGASAALLKLEDGFFRIALTFTPAAAVGSIALNAGAASSIANYAGDTAKGCYLAQVQLELGTSPGPLVLTTTASRTVLAPDRDAEDIFAYLVSETDQGEYAAGLSRVVREFARIPRVQISYPPRRFITKPDYTPDASETASVAIPYDDSGGGTLVGDAFDYNPYAALGSSYIGVGGGIYVESTGNYYANYKTPTSPVYGSATAGTFTLTYKTSTTAALAYNASNATIAAALNALADVITDGLTLFANNNLTLSGGAASLFIYGGTLSTAITMDATGLTVTTSKNPTTSLYSGALYITLPTHVTITAHGLSTSLDLAVVYQSTVTNTYATGEWGSIDANTIWIPNRTTYPTPSLVATFGFTPTVPAASTYAGGTRFTRQRFTETYYLPGVSIGISTAADITLPADLQNPDTFLAALLVPQTGFQNYENDGPSPWLNFPMYVVRNTAVHFTDLV